MLTEIEAAPLPVTGEVTVCEVGGRPTKYRPEYCAEVIEHVANGGSLTTFAASVRVSRRTVDNWRESWPEFGEAADIAKAAGTAWWVDRAKEVAQGKGGAGSASIVVFMLKNFAPDDFRDVQQHEHTGRLIRQPLSYEEAAAEAQRRGLPTAILDE